MTCKLSVVAPVFTDETETVGYAARVLAESARAAVGESYEIVFTDDGSSPRAVEAMRELGRRDPRIRVIGDGRHHGLGEVVRRGIREASGDYILYTDGDGQVACRELAEIWPRLSDWDLVIGYRTGRREGLLRRTATRLLSAITPLIYGKAIRDVDCAFKVASARFFRSMDLVSRGTAIDAEMLLVAARRGARLCEVPVRHTPPFGRKSRVTVGRVLYGFMEFCNAFLRFRTGPVR